MKIYALIVTYNRKNLLLQLLKSFLEQTVKISKVFIVDNDSTDGTPEFLLEEGIVSWYKTNEISKNMWNQIEVNYFRNSKNVGG